MGGSPVTLRLSVENLEAAAARAISAGALLLRPIQDQACGGRSGTLADPFGHIWSLYTHRTSKSRSLSSDLAQQIPANGKHSPLAQKVGF
jgi:PhnB protein